VPGTIDVVIPVYNRFELTESCLRHLSVQTTAHRIIVVDDGSTDDTRERLERDWPQVTVVALGSNQAYTVAVNRGVDRGDGDCVVLLNNDVDLQPDCLERLVAPLAADPRVGAVASVMLRPGGRAIDSVGVCADATLAGFPRLQGLAAECAGEPEPVLCGPEATACAFRRTAWEQVGGMDERIQAYMEILDLGFRLRSAGWAAVTAPGAVGVHLGSGTYGSLSARQRRLSGYSRGYLLRRYGVMRRRSAARALVTEALVVAADAVLARDLHSLAGRAAGWRAARGLPRRAWPPAAAIDSSIGFRRAMGLRRASRGRPAA
jgi:GT2 family glycosyltransferase